MADLSNYRTAKRFAKMDYDKQVAQRGGGGTGLDAAGPPSWNRAAWDAFHQQYGEYPFNASHLPPTFDGAPPWVYELMGLRQPPVQVHLGSDGAGNVGAAFSRMRPGG